MRKSNKVSSHKKAYIPNYIPFQDLSKEIHNIDAGKVNDINDLLPNSTENFQGCYPEASEYVFRLAKFYLHVDKQRKDKLHWENMIGISFFLW